MICKKQLFYESALIDEALTAVAEDFTTFQEKINNEVKTTEPTSIGMFKEIPPAIEAVAVSVHTTATSDPRTLRVEQFSQQVFI